MSNPSESTGSESVNDSVGSDRVSRRRKRFRRIMLGGMIVAIAVGPYIFYRVTSPVNRIQVSVSQAEQEQTGFQGTLRVLTYNIAHGRGPETSNLKEGRDPKIARIMEIAAMIRDLKADIVVLNEVDFDASWSGRFDQAALLAEHAGMPFVVRQTNLDCGYWNWRWQFGNAVLSRYPVTATEVVNLQPFKEWEDWLVGSKRGVLCTIQVAPGKSIAVMAVHLEFRSEAARVVSANVIAEIANSVKTPLLVVGDLNTTPAEAPRANLTADGENAFDILIQKSGLARMPAYLPSFDELTFPTWAPHTAIDWILFDPNSFRPVNHRVIKSQLSDHLPVLDTFEFLRHGSESHQE